MRKSKSLHHIIIDNISICTNLRYNLKTNHIGIRTMYQYQKPYIKEYQKQNENKIKKYHEEYRNQNKNTIKEYAKKYHEQNKDKLNKYNKKYRKQHRNPNTPYSGSKEHKISVSCRHQGITRNEWNGFITELPYCEKWTEKLREKIRNKYNNCDYISGIHKDVCNPNEKLSVHHINYDKQCGCNNTKCKLIPLSRKNHIRTNSNRPFWNKLFIYSLEIDKWYYKTTSCSL